MYSDKLPDEECSEFTTTPNVAYKAVDRGATATGTYYDDEPGYEDISLVTRNAVVTPDTKARIRTEDNYDYVDSTKSLKTLNWIIISIIYP